MKTSHFVNLAAALLVASTALPQTPTPRPTAPQTPRPTAPQTPRPQRRAVPTAPTAAHIVVRDNSGTPLEGVHVQIGAAGAANRNLVTAADGTLSIPLAPGTYRLRFDREGFITLEREATIGARQAAEIAIVLNLAPAPPPPPAAPPPVPPPAPPAPAAAVPRGSPANVSIPTFLDKNFIGRESIKESVLGCTGSATTRLLQLKDPLGMHVHDQGDEILYVVAGEGTIRTEDTPTDVAPGSLSVMPRGVAHAINRRGKNPLIVLSTVTGAPCTSSLGATTASK